MTALNLTALAPLIGKWRTRAFTEDRVFGPGVPVTITEEFYWLEGGHFLVQTYETVFGDEPAQRGINYWFHDSETGKFRIIFFSNNGAFTEDGNRYEGQIVGTALTFVGPARFQYELDANGRIKKDDDGTITVSLRDDRGQFQPWMTNVFRRVGTLEKTESTSDAIEIRGLLERWVAAVQACDLDSALRDRADDIVMFDVPRPETGVRGLHAYRDSWPPFFRWLQQGDVRVRHAGGHSRRRRRVRARTAPMQHPGNTAEPP